MEEEKKKKKTKKKKNKQNKTTEDVAVGVEETASLDQNHVVGQNHRSQVSETADVHSAGVEKHNVDLDRHRTNGTEGSILAEANKQYWMQREASLEETIKQFKNEKDSFIQKLAGLEMRIVQLQSEKDSWLQKEDGLEEKVSQLLYEKDSWRQKEDGLEGKVSQLLYEKATLSLKGANLEEKIKHLEREKDSWVLKENSTKEIICSLNDDNSRLRIQVMELEESRNKILQENQLLMENISGLQSQIQNLESTSSARLSTEITKHASEIEDLNSQMEAARSLVEKLSAENMELVEKVNELYIELDRRSVTAGLASAIGSGPMVGTIGTAAVADPMIEFSKMSVSGERMESLEAVPIKDERTGGDNVDTEYTAVIANSSEIGTIGSATLADPMLESSKMSVSGERMESLEAVPIKDERTGGDNVDTEYTAVIANFSETSESGGIVQIPLDENEVRDVELQVAESDDKAVAQIPLDENEVRDVELQVAESDDKAVVPLSDAPLIGAPFRLISFFAKYVSGADLVNKSSS